MDGRPKLVKYEIQKKTSQLSYPATLFHCRFLVDITRFSPCVINISRNMNKLSRKIERGSTLRNKFWLCCLLVFHQIHIQRALHLA